MPPIPIHQLPRWMLAQGSSRVLIFMDPVRQMREMPERGAPVRWLFRVVVLVDPGNDENTLTVRSWVTNQRLHDEILEAYAQLGLSRLPYLDTAIVRDGYGSSGRLRIEPIIRNLGRAPGEAPSDPDVPVIAVDLPVPLPKPTGRRIRVELPDLPPVKPKHPPAILPVHWEPMPKRKRTRRK